MHVEGQVCIVHLPIAAIEIRMFYNFLLEFLEKHCNHNENIERGVLNVNS